VKTIYEGTYDFIGLWDIPSKCGLKIVTTDIKTIVIVTELYKENPGTTITDMPAKLAVQICSHFGINPDSLIYIEHNPKIKSKLSFYEEEFFRVYFTKTDGRLESPEYKEISGNELKGLLQ